MIIGPTYPVYLYFQGRKHPRFEEAKDSSELVLM
jgi:hypothetical protein